MWPLWAHRLSGEVCRKDCAQSERERERDSEGVKVSRAAATRKETESRTAGDKSLPDFHFIYFFGIVGALWTRALLSICLFVCFLFLFFLRGGVARKFHFFCLSAVDVRKRAKAFFFFFSKHTAGGMYPTRAAAAAAGQRPWRCPGCALWIALLLHSVLDLSASGESSTPRLSFPSSPPSAGPASLCGSDLSWELFVGTWSMCPRQAVALQRL